MTSRQDNKNRDERGSISLWMVTSSFVMMVLVGLAVDLGGQVHAQQRARDLAAQAARTGGQQVQAAPAIEGRYLNVDASAARSAAEAYLSAAGIDGTVSISGGDTITVQVTDTYEPRFLGLLGIDHLDVTGTATARLVRSLGGTEQ
jgi:Flp pilus assembly protein TadG